jgi:copper chaperone CopZ
MFTRRLVLTVFAVALAGFNSSRTQATETQATTITIQGMHCGGCAAKATRHLQTVEGISTAQADAGQANAIVTPKTNAVPSPRALWEAVEKAGYKPTKLIGPSGTFTEKPKS